MVDAFLRWWHRRPPTKPRVVKTYAFNAGDSVHGFHEFVRFDPETWTGAGWEAAVRQETGFEQCRVEIRLVEGARKRRVVLYPGDLCDPTFPQPPRRVIVAARLIARQNTDASTMDITKRVQKYIGNPLKSIHDMFPFDDHADNVQRFTHVRIIDLLLTLVDVPLPEV